MYFTIYRFVSGIALASVRKPQSSMAHSCIYVPPDAYRIGCHPVRFEVFTAVIMPSPRMSYRVVLVKTDVSKEFMASIISVKRIGGLGTRLAITINRSTLI
jgi:hypothetical protein